MPGFDPLGFDWAGFDVSTPVGLPIPSPDRRTDYPIMLEIDGVEMGAWLEWRMSFEEILGAIGRAQLVLQDRTNSWVPRNHATVKITHRSTGWIFYTGEILTPTTDLQLLFPWRRWNLDCRDWNSAFAERLLGAPNDSFWSPGEGEDFINIDPSALITGHPFADWCDQYVGIPGAALDTTSMVGDYPLDIGDDPNADYRFYNSMTNVQSALEQMASASALNIQFWIRPDYVGVWAAIPRWQDLTMGGDQGILENAPFAVVGTEEEADDTHIGHSGITGVAFDGGNMPETIYIQGATGSTLRDPEGGDFRVDEGGTGWYPVLGGAGNKYFRQAYVSAPGAKSQDERESFGAAYMARAAYPTMRASMKLITGKVGLRAGQVMDISDPRMPPSMYPGGRFVLQSIRTTIIPTTDIFVYDVSFGDGADGRESQYSQMDQAAAVAQDVANFTSRQPVDKFSITTDDVLTGNPNQTTVLRVTPLTVEYQPIGVPGISIDLEVKGYIVADDNTLTYVPGQGSFGETTIVTDVDGRAHTTFTTGSVAGLRYIIKCSALF